MNRIVIIIVSALGMVLTPLTAQESVTISQCFESARSNHSLATEKERYTEIFNLTSQILQKVWYPTADASGSYLYNSEVVDMSGVFAAIPVPGLADAITPLPNSQYRVTVDVTQLIYDGGVTRVNRSAGEASMLISQQQTEVELYRIRNASSPPTLAYYSSKNSNCSSATTLKPPHRAWKPSNRLSSTASSPPPTATYLWPKNCACSSNQTKTEYWRTHSGRYSKA